MGRTDQAPYGKITTLRSYSSHQFEEGETLLANGYRFLILTVRDAPSYERHNQEAILFQYDHSQRLLPQCTACGGLMDGPHVEEYYCPQCFQRVVRQTHS